MRADRDLAPAEKEALGAWMREVFHDDSEPLVWSESDWHVFVQVDGELVSHVEIVERTCNVGDRPVRVGGIGGVATRAPWRCRGLASQAMARAARVVCDDLGLAFGLLICNRDMIPFYQRLGWQAVPGPTVFYQPGGKMENDGATMVWSCRGESWPAGEIDLCGLPW